ncbi:MAG: LytTR family transcriptional regulator DNA-binding domain-containing protein [Clostridia bacterium]|nr:LytTR family transcriptional regulator DNA-binding domain-containing protein [Clostridia bacterium]MBQ8767047.1 LytTR family transcriptional regulator DNA-binding domain-containing protein [Clostridia bacterium]
MKEKELEQAISKEDIIEILDANDISYIITNCKGYERICVSLGYEQNNTYNSPITLQTCNKDICKIYSHEILYIAIENRKSVLYLIDRKIETNYNIDHWKKVLNEKIFAQPHYSYIVNLNYVEEVTKDFVTLRYAGNEYKVYTSLRKIGAFKKAVLEFNG